MHQNCGKMEKKKRKKKNRNIYLYLRRKTKLFRHFRRNNRRYSVAVKKEKETQKIKNNMHKKSHRIKEKSELPGSWWRR